MRNVQIMSLLKLAKTENFLLIRTGSTFSRKIICCGRLVGLSRWTRVCNLFSSGGVSTSYCYWVNLQIVFNSSARSCLSIGSESTETASHNISVMHTNKCYLLFQCVNSNNLFLCSFLCLYDSFWKIWHSNFTIINIIKPSLVKLVNYQTWFGKT